MKQAFVLQHDNGIFLGVCDKWHKAFDNAWKVMKLSRYCDSDKDLIIETTQESDEVVFTIGTRKYTYLNAENFQNALNDHGFARMQVKPPLVQTEPDLYRSVNVTLVDLLE